MEELERRAREDKGQVSDTGSTHCWTELKIRLRSPLQVPQVPQVV